jgi:ketosteroid isomerase-like protein
VAQPPDLAASSEDEETHRARLAGELQDDILTSYDRDEPPELGSGMIDRRIGTARIGPGPGDVYIADDLARAPSRWPLDLDPATRTEVRSKRLEIEISADQTAAWMADELSWRIKMCGRTAAIPLRLTALYAHDGDRWVPVFEHLSFGLPPMPLDAPLPRAIKTAVLSGDLKDELSGILGRGLFRTPHDPQVAAQDRSALVLGPDAGDEWHAAHVLEARLPAGKLEDRRVGTVGRRSDNATVAYWIGNYIASIPARPGGPAGKARMRVTHVFEKRRDATRDTKGTDARSCAEDPVTKKQPADCRWLLVQSHMSQPITDDELTKQVFGTALISPKPLELDCSERPRTTAPAAAPRPGATPPAA